LTFKNICIILIVMYIVENKSKAGKKIYNSTLLRTSYREAGKVKNTTIANLSKCTPGEIMAIKLALKHKDDLSVLGSLKDSIEIQEGLSVGACWTIYEVAKRLGIEKALGGTFSGKLGLWQVIAREIEQGSRLSAVRLAGYHAAADILGFDRGFDENDLYENLTWLSENQESIEDRLYSQRCGKEKPELFLYDVTSSYLEGDCNELGEYGYNRDGKKGKKQIVIGMLCDEEGMPVSTECFSGNIRDHQTFYSQVQKAIERFGCEQVTFVGDRGMLKSTQIEEVCRAGYHYITAITKPQIRKMLEEGLIQMSFFDEDLYEKEHGGVRYVLKRNPVRVHQLSENRKDKERKVREFVEKKNQYLLVHPRGKVETAVRHVQGKISKLKLDGWLKLEIDDRKLILIKDEELLKELTILDGCYVLKTDLSEKLVSGKIIHDRYKDLALVETAFRTCKTKHLEVRPIYVRTEKHTRAHVLVTMLAYMIVRELRKAWEMINVTVEEGIKQLSTLCSMQIKVKGQGACLKIPKPRAKSQELLKALNITLPSVLPHKNVKVVTRKKVRKHD